MILFLFFCPFCKQYARHLADSLLNFSLADIANSILLCKNCYTVFDDPEPGFTLLPADLDYFVQFEEEDFKRRQAIVDQDREEQLEVRNVPPWSHMTPPPCRYPTVKEYLEARITKEPKRPSSALGVLVFKILRRIKSKRKPMTYNNTQ